MLWVPRRTSPGRVQRLQWCVSSDFPVVVIGRCRGCTPLGEARLFRAEQSVWIAGLRGRALTADDVRAALRPPTRYAPPQRLLEVEQTANVGGGTVWPLARLNEVAAVVRG